MLGETNITTTLVAQTLGSPSHNVRELCTHTNINMWSRWKPTYISVGTLSESSLVAADFSVILPSQSNDITVAYNRSYIYKKPAGTVSSPYRLGDFRNYSHDSIPPCKGTGDITVNKSAINKTFILPINLVGSSDGIGLNEINRELKNYYLGIAFEYTYNGSTVITYKTDTSTIGSTGGTGITFSLSTDYPFSLNITNATYYWIACSKVKTGANSSGPSDQLFYALPFASSAEAKGNLKIEGGGSDVQFGIPTGVMQYYDDTFVDEFRQYQPEVSSPERYFRVSNSGDLHFEYNVKNNNSIPKTVSLNDLSHSTTAINYPSFGSQPAPNTGTVPLNWYQYINNKWAIVKSVTIQANSSVVLRMGQDGWAAYKKGQPTIGVENGLKAVTNINLTLTGSSLTDFIINLSS